MKISVVVPVYQSKDYLPQCIDSILRQTYKNIEIILIDDGSTDGSGQICDDYAEIYPQIRVYHQQNKGASAARNKGIELSEGELLVFIDSDDYIESRTLECAVKSMDDSDIDMFLYGFQVVSKEGYRIKTLNIPGIREGNHKVKEMGGGQLLSLFRSGTLSAIGSKVYRRKLIVEWGIQYKTEWRFCEDYYFCMSYMRNCTKISVLNRALYYYRQGMEYSLSQRYIENKYECVSKTMHLLKELLGCYFGIKTVREDYLSNYCSWMLGVINNEYSNPAGNYKSMRSLYNMISDDRLFQEGMDYYPIVVNDLQKKELQHIANKRFFHAYFCYRLVEIEKNFGLL